MSDDFNRSKASLECYEDANMIMGTISVNIGRNGLGWGIGDVNLTRLPNEPLKYEGDKKAPIGVFKLTSIYGYAKKSNYLMPYLHTSKKLICVDDSDSPFYNKIIEAHGDEKSFEYMKRNDDLYEIGVVVEHNKLAESKRGSCIFLHVKKSENAPTAGCTSMSLKEIKKIVSWLDKDKNPILIQIPKSSSAEILKLYPELKNSKLLKQKK